ncbi:ABC transporter permease subunit [Opitutia bacterium ISCC 51]|nr:ABC transporter permease subunit [Opitutae bacterium ISCC 51]QXD30153.1 ABC transporter permease subunit [Opitutae bacterium ISCC 52]
MNFKKYSPFLMPILSTIVIITLWYTIGSLIVDSNMKTEGYTKEDAEAIRRIQMPYPTEIWQAMVDERADLITAAKNTFVSAAIGFVAAITIGYIIAMIFAASSLVKHATYPWVLVLQMTPVVILAPIIAIWLKEGRSAITLVTFLIGFFPIVANSTQGLISTDRNLLDLFTVCNASKVQEIFLLRVPFSMPYFLTGMKIAGTLAPIGAITGDIFVGTSASGGAGLGFMTIVYNSNVKIPALFATATIACTMGFVFVGSVNLIHWLALRNWHDSMIHKQK